MFLLYMNPILIAAAVVAAVFLLIRVYRTDRLEPEPSGLLLSLILRGVFATVIAMVLEELVRDRIGCKVRSIELNLMQRCAAHLASATDLEESRMLGMKACQCALEKQGGQMASIRSISADPYRVEYTSVPVSEVANKEKKVPLPWITEDGHDVTEEMMAYLRPLILGEPAMQYENGIPVHIELY